MSKPVVLADVLEAAEELDSESQAELVAVLSRRIAERGRARVAAGAMEARREFEAGECRVATPKELLQEALS